MLSCFEVIGRIPCLFVGVLGCVRACVCFVLICCF